MQQLPDVRVGNPADVHPIISSRRLAKHDRRLPMAFRRTRRGEAEHRRARQSYRDAVGYYRVGDGVAWVLVLRAPRG